MQADLGAHPVPAREGRVELDGLLGELERALRVARAAVRLGGVGLEVGALRVELDGAVEVVHRVAEVVGAGSARPMMYCASALVGWSTTTERSIWSASP